MTSRGRLMATQTADAPRRVGGDRSRGVSLILLGGLCGLAWAAGLRNPSVDGHRSNLADFAAWHRGGTPWILSHARNPCPHADRLADGRMAAPADPQS